MRQYLPAVIIVVLTGIPVALMANSYYNGEVIEFGKYVLPLIAPITTGIIYYAQTKVKEGLDIFKIEVRHDVAKVQDGFAELKCETVEIKETMNGVRDDMNMLLFVEKSKKEFKIQLEIASKESINMLEDDDRLKRFATLKTKSFTDFVCDLRDSVDEITEDIFEGKKNQGICLSDELRKEGMTIISERVVEKYYNNHGKKVIEFLDKIEKIIFTDNIHKMIIYQDECLKFLRQFVSDLDKCYIKYN